MAKKRSAHFDHSLNLVHHRQVYGIELLETLIMNSKLQTHQNERSNTHLTTFPEKVHEQLLSFSNEQSKVAEQLDSLVGKDSPS
jgi:exopolyphosphatase/pppGpp-phosphohydrolase